MKTLPSVFLATLLGVAFSSAADGLKTLKERERKVTAVVEKAMPSVVALVGAEAGMAASGSGVVISKDGLIMTAGHVTDAAGKELTVYFSDGRRVKAESLGSNLSRDAGFARIVEEGDWPVSEVGDSDAVALGDWVVAMGHPGGFQLTRTPPVRIGRVVNLGALGMIGTDCTLVGGDSGGPLFDLDGKVIGIHSSIGGSLAENRHVPASVYEIDRERMLAGEVWGSLGMMAAGQSADRPMLGVQMEPADRGVRIRGFVTGSPAKKAGMKVGDVIVAIDGMEVPDTITFSDYVSSQRAGEVVKIRVRREGGNKTLRVKLVRWDDLAGGIRREMENEAEEELAEAPSGKPRLGVMLDRKAEVEGAAIHEVIVGSPAAEAGLLAGDVLIAIDGESVSGVAAVEAWFAEREPGDKTEFKVRRGDGEETVGLTLGER